MMLQLWLISILSLCIYAKYEDKPCIPKPYPGQSVVCVCNATYCDELQRSIPTRDTFVVYTSTESGLRFHKDVKKFKNSCNDCTSYHLVLEPEVTYQKIQGFGGAVTDAAGINWNSLQPSLRNFFVDSYYTFNGLEYNMARVPIGGSDFSTHAYAYNELPVDDTHLTNFTLAPEDHQYKIPLFREILKASKVQVQIVATTWSPPPWMKSNNDFTGFSSLKDEHYQTYADYHIKFLKHYKSEGIPIWGITTTNEPVNGIYNLVSFNSLGWTPGDMGKWIVNNLGPTIRNSEFNQTKVLTCDDQRYSLLLWFDHLVQQYPKALEYIDGLAVHYYFDPLIPAAVLDLVTKRHPDKFILGTEACEGSYPWDVNKVELGSWKRATTYIKDIISDLNHNVVGWIDWNMCLDPQGGPNWANNFVDSPIIVFADKQEFYKQPMYYALAHVTKFLPRDSIRINVKTSHTSVEQVAFLTPRNTVVLIIYNSGNETSINIKCYEKTAKLNIMEKSITTVEFLYRKETK